MENLYMIVKGLLAEGRSAISIAKHLRENYTTIPWVQLQKLIRQIVEERQ